MLLTKTKLVVLAALAQLVPIFLVMALGYTTDTKIESPGQFDYNKHPRANPLGLFSDSEAAKEYYNLAQPFVSQLVFNWAGVGQFVQGALLALTLPFIVIPWPCIDQTKPGLIGRGFTVMVKHQYKICWSFIVITAILEAASAFKIIDYPAPTRMAARDAFYAAIILLLQKKREMSRLPAQAANVYEAKRQVCLQWQFLIGLAAELRWCWEYYKYQPATINPINVLPPTVPTATIFVVMTLAGIFVYNQVYQTNKGQWLVLALFTFMTGAHIASAAGWYFLITHLTEAKPKTKST